MTMKRYFFLTAIVLFVFAGGVHADIDVVSEQPVIPVLIDRSDNMVLRVAVQGPGVLDELVVDTAGCSDLKDVDLARLYYAGLEKPTGIKVSYHQFGPAKKPAGKIVFKGPQELKEGRNYFVVGYKLRPETNLLHYVGAKCVSVTVDGKVVKPMHKGGGKLRLGVKVRHNGDDGCKGYRIPGMVTTNKGTLLATYDIRWDSRRDLQGHMDIGLSRSVDGGQTWEPMRAVLDMKQWGDLPERFNGVSDAGILVDRNTGRIFVFGCWMYGLRNKDGSFRDDLTKTSKDWAHQWHRGSVGSGKGMTPKETAQFVMAFSDDDGKTWSKPRNLTKSVKRNPEWWLFAPAPGNGITLSDGTLVLPSQGRDENQRVFSNIIYSKDHGKTWQCSEGYNSGTNECAIVELEDGSIILNGRDSQHRSSKRGVAVTKDLGKTWQKHPTDHKALIEPTCMASLIEHAYEYDGKKLLLFSNPDSTKKRHRMTIKASLDDGMTWPEGRRLLLDEFGGAYSSLASVDKDSVGIFYESSQGDLIFQRISLEDILSSR